MPLGNRHDQPQVRADDLILKRYRFLIQRFDLVHQRALGARWVHLATKFTGLVLQEVELAEQVRFLLAR